MDVFHIDSSSISSTMLDADPSVVDEITEVKFESQEFDLNFFDTPDDSMTQAAFSNPNSVESSLSPTPEPLTTTALVQQSAATRNLQSMHQNMAQPAIAIIKNGEDSVRFSSKNKTTSFPHAWTFRFFFADHKL